MSEALKGMNCGDGYRRPENGCLFRDELIPKTADYTIPSDLDTGQAYSNTGAAAAVTFTLPAPKFGCTVFTFIKTVPDQNIVLQMPAGVSIAGGTAAATYQNVTDETGNGTAICVVVGLSSTAYIIFTEKGTWANA